MLLALVATALLLAGALHEVTRPLLQESSRIQVTQNELHSLEAEARQLRAKLDAFRDMAAVQGRRGWQEDIRRDTTRLLAINDQLRTLSSSSKELPWLNQVTQIAVIAVAVLFQVAAVLALWSLSRSARNAEPLFRPVAEPKAAPEMPPVSVSEIFSARAETFRKSTQAQARNFYQRLWSHIEAHSRSSSARLAQGNGTVSQAALARDLGISRPDLSGIKLLAQGQRVPRNPSREAVERLAARFGVSLPK